VATGSGYKRPNRPERTPCRDVDARSPGPARLKGNLGGCTNLHLTRPPRTDAPADPRHPAGCSIGPPPPDVAALRRGPRTTWRQHPGPSVTGGDRHRADHLRGLPSGRKIVFDSRTYASIFVCDDRPRTRGPDDRRLMDFPVGPPALWIPSAEDLVARLKRSTVGEIEQPSPEARPDLGRGEAPAIGTTSPPPWKNLPVRAGMVLSQRGHPSGTRWHGTRPPTAVANSSPKPGPPGTNQETDRLRPT